MNALLLLLTLTTSMLVLRTGERIAVEGTPARENGVITFRSGGQLYSMPESEVASVQDLATEPAAPPLKRLRVSEEERKRIIAELEQNHEATPAPPQRSIEEVLPTPAPEERERQSDEEWSWRQRARDHEENLRRAKEDLELLESRIDELRSEIHSFFSLGYKPQQFTYQATQLARAEERLPAARLEVVRAQREWDQFRDDARKRGIPPGWLR